MAPQTDQQWLEHLASAAPQDLTADEIAALRERMVASPELRAALAEHLQLEQLLAAGLRPLELSADQIIDRAKRSPQKRATSLWAALGLAIVLLLSLSGALWLLGERLFPGANVARNADQQPDDLPPGEDLPPGVDDPTAQRILQARQRDLDQGKHGAELPDDPRGPNAPASGGNLPLRIDVLADQLARGNVLVKKLPGMADAPKVIFESGADEASWAEYEVDVPKAGEYDLLIRYMNTYSRPISISVNGQEVRGAAAGEDTRSRMIWSNEHEITLQSGNNVIRFEGRRNPETKKKQSIPRIAQFALVENRAAQDAKLAAAEPIKPWQEERQLGGAPRSFEQVCFDDFHPNDDGVTRDELIRWLSGDNRFTVDDMQWLHAAQFSGQAKLMPQWPDDAALRFSLQDYNLFRIYLLRGKAGVQLQFYNNLRQLAAYRIEAGSTAGNAKTMPPMAVKGLLATDNDRLWRSHPVEPASYEIRCQQGQLVVSRGDLRLLTVLLDGPPDAVYFDGRAAIRQFSFIHSPGLPPTLAAKPGEQLILAKPAELNWQGQLPEGCQLNRREDGAVELTADRPKQAAWQSFKLPQAGPCEIIAELDNVRPGGRLFLGNDQGQPQYVIGFPSERRSGGLSAMFLSPGDNRLESEFDPAFNLAPLVAPHTWVRLVFGAGTLKFWTSNDGANWSRIAEPLTNLEGPLATFGLGHAPGDGRRQITLRQISIRPLPQLQSLVSAELLKQAVAVRANQFQPWQEAVLKQQPAGVDPLLWRRACALRTLGAGTSKLLGSKLLDDLVDDALDGALPAERWFDLLDEVSLMTDAWGNSADGVLRLSQLYERAGDRLYRAGQTRPFSVAVQRLMNAPITAVNRPSPESRILPNALLRAEAFELIYGRQSDDLRAFAKIVRFWNRDDPLLPLLENRIGRPAARDTSVRVVRRDPRKTSPLDRLDRRHPLVEEVSKEGYNIMAEFEAAVANKSYRDACELIAGLLPSEVQGLLPSSTDPNLLITLSAAVELAMRDHPDLRAMMVDNFGPIAAVRLKQAVADGDESAIAAISVQFQGTPAAGEAHLWLGDRALSTGDALLAREHYRLAQRSASATTRGALAARQRLAAAMLGRNEGEPISVPVDLGNVQLSPGDFEAVVADLLRRSPTAGSMIHVGQVRDTAPAPSGYTATIKEELSGEFGNDNADTSESQKFESFYNAKRDNPGRDYLGRQMAMFADGDLLLVTNRFDVWAYDAKTGQKRWESPAKNPGRPDKPWAFDWPLTPMRPVVVGDKIYVRRLMRPNLELACLNRENGQMIADWHPPQNLTAASDPVMIQDRLYVLSSVPSDQTFTISLSVLDAGSGNLLVQRKLFDVRRSWWTQRTCHLCPLGNGLAAVCGASVFCCDLQGQLNWIRRQDWISDADDRSWVGQFQEPPLVMGDRLFATQPGVHCIESIDADTGRAIWRRVLPTVRRISGLADGKLIAETDDALVALDVETGNPLWYHDRQGALNAQLCGGPGKLAYFIRQRDPNDNNSTRPVMVWVDPSTGKTAAATPLEALRFVDVQLGSVVRVGDHLWGLVGKTETKPLWQLFELAPGGTLALPKPAAVN